MFTVLSSIGVGLCCTSATIRALKPKWIVSSFILSTIGSISLSIYSIITLQLDVLVLNIFSLVMSILGIWRWRNVKVKDEVNNDSKTN